ncbi:MAG: thiamine pyrophosphate-binding protein [Solirubrobacteraceae bacterium]
MTGVEVDGGEIVAQALAEHRTEVLFTVNGGHVFPILGALRDHGIRMIHVRHEQTAAYAADGYARSCGRPGVLCVTAGCGLTNAVTGLCQAALADSSVVCIAGQHPSGEDGIGSFQEAYGSEIAGSFALWTKRVLDSATIGRDVRAALRAAMTPPRGVALVEIPIDVLHRPTSSERQRPGEQTHGNWPPRSLAEPVLVDRAVELLANAERPLIVAGDGVFWSGASADLTNLARLTNTPVYSRRAGQGSLSEDSPLAVRGAWKKQVTSSADLVIAVGFKFWSGEHFGAAPAWNPDAKLIQIDAAPERIGWHLPACVGLLGDPALVLEQLTERIATSRTDFSDRADGPWLRRISGVRDAYQDQLSEQASEHHRDVPTHPHRLMSELVDVLDEDATIVTDSFTLSGYASGWLRARSAGQFLDAGPLAPVGHGVGMAIGAQLARPGKQVVVLSGDGGLGIGGMDLETAARYKLPIVVVLWNNSSWGPGFELMPTLRGRTDPFEMLPAIRYDEVFAPMGVHGEHVPEPSGLRSAIERALGTGGPALLNVVGDKRIGHPTLGGNLLGSSRVPA